MKTRLFILFNVLLFLDGMGADISSQTDCGPVYEKNNSTELIATSYDLITNPNNYTHETLHI